MSTIVRWDELPIDDLIGSAGLVKREQGRKKRPGERDVFNLVTAFDIETTTIHCRQPDDASHDEHSFMYVWQWQFGPAYTVMGRTWDEFRYLVSEIYRVCSNGYIGDEIPCVVVYVHNLAYEFQFLSGIYNFSDDECFFVKPRIPLRVHMYDCLEFRCSYKQSNMTLKKFAENMGASVRKQSGQKFDYSKIRYPWTELTPEEIEYCIDDVICLEESIRLEMKHDGDDLLTIPMTSTGYVRRDLKLAVRPYYKYIKSMLPDLDQYRLLRQCFRGGNTHANRYYTGKIIDNVCSVDMASCYPAQQLTKKFPMRKFKWLDNPDLSKVIHYISGDYAVCGTYRFLRIRLKNEKEPIPYLSIAKCRCNKFVSDNGRLLEAEYCETSLTEIDLQIVIDTYDWDMVQVTQAMVAQKDYLLPDYRMIIKSYYDKKTELKGVHGREYEYGKAKNKLNSVYGMSAQDPVHAKVLYNGGDYLVSDYTMDDVDGVLRQAAFPYQWGVYTTAYARQALQEGIKMAGSKIIYCDTDSLKTDGAIEELFSLNRDRKKLAERKKAVCADPSGVMHYMGVYEDEGMYDKFITQGAKKYAYIKGGKMGVTVAGVSKQINEETGVSYAVEELGCLENFKDGMIFDKAGGTASLYHDKDDFIITIDGHELHITKNVSIVPVTYELMYSKDYWKLLRDIELYGKWRHDHE